MPVGYSSLSRITVLQVRFDTGPLGWQDAINTGVAECAVRSHAVAAQDAIELRPKPFNRAPALLVEEVRAKLHCDTVFRLEGVPQQEEFAGGVQRTALGGEGVPCRTDFHSTVDPVNVHIGRHANDLARRCALHREGQHRPIPL